MMDQLRGGLAGWLVGLAYSLSPKASIDRIEEAMNEGLRTMPMRAYQNVTRQQFDALLKRLDRLTELVIALHRKENITMAKIDEVLADVAEEATLIGSLDTLLTNLQTQIAGLKSNQTDPETAAKIEALATAVRSNRDRIKEEVIENTPVDTPIDPNAPTPAPPA